MLKTLDELINAGGEGWPVLEDWIRQAKNHVEILPCNRHRADEALVQVQVTTHSLIGAVVYETGGLLVDNGWIRILGSGSERMKRTLPAWNRGKTFQEYGERSPYLLVADDVTGGFYAINGGYFGDDLGKMYYFTPDLPDWLPMKIDYAGFLIFCFDSNLDEFYEGLRWNGWENDIAEVSGDYAYTFFPFLWAKEGKDINLVDRRLVPVEEVYNFNMEMGTALNNK